MSGNLTVEVRFPRIWYAFGTHLVRFEIPTTPAVTGLVRLYTYFLYLTRI